MKTLFRGVVDMIGFVVGPFFTAYYLLDFSHGPAGPGPFYYYYRHNSRLGFGLGVALICLGFLVRYWAKLAPSKPSKQLSEEPRKRPPATSQRTRRPKEEVKPSHTERRGMASRSDTPAKET